MKAIERKKQFIKWAENYPEHKYNLTTINKYASVLEKLEVVLEIDIGIKFFDIDTEEM